MSLPGLFGHGPHGKLVPEAVAVRDFDHVHDRTDGARVRCVVELEARVGLIDGHLRAEARLHDAGRRDVDAGDRSRDGWTERVGALAGGARRHRQDRGEHAHHRDRSKHNQITSPITVVVVACTGSRAKLYTFSYRIEETGSLETQIWEPGPNPPGAGIAGRGA